MYRKRTESVLKEIVQPAHINYNESMNMPTEFENCAPNDCVFSVSQITDILKELVETSFPSLTVEGEISNYRPSSTGHAYFTLKDEKAALSAVMFKGKCKNLSFVPVDGIKVKATGSLSVYALRGTYQLVVDEMEEAGSGDILKMLEQLKRRLAAEGLFDSEKKRQLPFFPERIGVVTSPTGAALRDILQITSRRNPKVSVTVLPCAVQGAEAAAQIAEQINRANMFSLADVLIVGRGGGSLEDLLPFSEEIVVRAVAASAIPVISAVGHEIDWALSDFAADVRASTPSAAAELAVPLLDDIVETLAFRVREFTQNIQNRIQNMRLLVKSFSTENLELRVRTVEQPLLQRFDDAKEELLFSFTNKLSDMRSRIVFARQSLESANPLSILERGYSVVRDSTNGKLIRSAQDVSAGAVLHIIPFTGTISAQVIHTDNTQRFTGESDEKL